MSVTIPKVELISFSYTVSTEEMRIADAIREIADFPWGAEHPASQRTIPGHPPVKVTGILIYGRQDLFAELVLGRFAPVDPVTLAAFIKKGVPYVLTTGTKWCGNIFSYSSVTFGKRFDVGGECKALPDIPVFFGKAD